MKACKRAPKCDGMLGDKSKNDFCEKCRTFKKRWKGRKADIVIKRHQLLVVWDLRLSEFIPETVTNIRKRA